MPNSNSRLNVPPRTEHRESSLAAKTNDRMGQFGEGRGFPQVPAVAQLEAMISRSPRSERQAHRAESLHQSRPMTAQRDRLARLYGNSRLDGNPQTRGVEASAGGTSQLKKDKPGSDAEWEAFIEGVGLGGSIERDEMIAELEQRPEGRPLANQRWNEANKRYQDSLAKGRGLWASLVSAIGKHRDDSGGDSSPKSILREENKRKRAEYLRQFKRFYASRVSAMPPPLPQKPIGGFKPEGSLTFKPRPPLSSKGPKAPGTARVRTEGYTGESAPNMTQPGWRGNYDNEFDLKSGTIAAHWDMADLDEARLADTREKTERQEQKSAGGDPGAEPEKRGLPNSEIFWQQYAMAARKELKASEDDPKDAEVQNEMKKISRIEQKTVINAETQDVVNVAMDPGQYWGEGSQEWSPDADEFQAVLGSPNGRSSAFMLVDHVDEFEKTIHQIGAARGNLKIELKPIEEKDPGS